MWDNYTSCATGGREDQKLPSAVGDWKDSAVRLASLASLEGEVIRSVTK